MITSELARQLAEEDAARPPVIPENGRASVASEIQPPQGPRVEFHRPWYQRFIGKGCNRCGGEPPGWLQRQIGRKRVNGEWFPRTAALVLWLVNLVPRGASFVRVVTSGRVSAVQYASRQATCASCPMAIQQLRMVKKSVRGTLWCGLCGCPKWVASRLDYKNTRKAHRCPAKRHDGSDPDAVFAEYIRVRTEQAAASALGAAISNGAPMTN